MLCPHILLAQFPEREGGKLGSLVGKGKVPGDGVPEGNGPVVAKLNLPLRPVGQEYHIHWHLSRQPEEVQGVRACRSNARPVPPGYLTHHVLDRRVQNAEPERLVDLWIQVDAVGQPYDYFIVVETLQGLGDRLDVSIRRKVAREKNCSSSALFDIANYLSTNGFMHIIRPNFVAYYYKFSTKEEFPIIFQRNA